MTGRSHFARKLLAAGVAMGCAWVAGSAQTTAPADNPAPCTVAPQPEPCGSKPAPPSKGNAAEKFPFPGTTVNSGDGSGSPAPDAASPGISGIPQAPDAPGPASAGKKPSGADFPFPGDDSKPAASASPGESSSSSSSSSSDDASPADGSSDSKPDATPALKDKGSDGSQATPGRHILHRVNPIGTKLQTPDEREAEDLSVARYYTQSGDLQGAYLRTQDAVKTAPDDPDAHFALAEIARKLNKRDQAIAEYTACLKLDPDDKKAGAARKALARLKP